MTDFNLPYDSLLEKQELDLLKSKSSLVRYSNKDNIYKQNTRTSHVMLLKKGMVKIYRESRYEKNFILRLALPDDFIGLTSIFGEDIFHCSASSVGDSELWIIDSATFKSVLQNNGQFAYKYLTYLSEQSIKMQNKLISQISKQLPGRIADVLLYFSNEIYKSTKFELPLTRKELAELAGTTKESFIRTLTEFKNDKIIEINGSVIEIKSLDIIKTLHNLG